MMKIREHIFLKILYPCLLLVLLLGISTTVWAGKSYVHGYFRYAVADDSVTITAYTGDEDVVTIPSMIAGNPVNTIASGAFAGADHTTTIYLPDTIMTVESGAFSAVQSVVFSGSNAAGTDASAEGKENGANKDDSKTDQGGSKTDQGGNKTDQGGSKTDGGKSEEGAVQGIRDDKGNLITTDDFGNLVRVDPEGNESVLDDTQKYTIKKGKDGQPVITNEKGDPVTVENGESVSFVDGDRNQVTVDSDGNKTVRDEENKNSYEEAEVDDPSEEKTETESGTGSTLPIVILCIAVIAAVFLIVKRKNHDH